MKNRMIQYNYSNYQYDSFEIKTKEQLYCIMNNRFGGFCIGSTKNSRYSGYISSSIHYNKRYSGYLSSSMHYNKKNDRIIYFYVAQKFRRKTENVQQKGKKYKPKKELRQGHWKVRIFGFPLDRIIEGEQLSNTFRVVLSI